MESGTKLCKRCNRRVPLTGFFVQRDSADGRKTSCKECEAATRRKGELLESGYNQQVYSRTIAMMKQRFGNG